MDIFFLFILLLRNKYCLFLIRYKSFFNLTMTYRRDSDIFLPYGELQSGDYVSTIKNKLKETSSRLTDDRKLVAWVVSHCETRSKREKYVQVN